MSLFETTVSGDKSSRSTSRTPTKGPSMMRAQTSAGMSCSDAGSANAGGGGGDGVEGYLEKYTEAAGKFQRRWFVLDLDQGGPALRYSGSSGQGERSAVPLERIRDVRPGFDLPTLTKSPNLEFQFTLSGSRRVMRLRAPTISEAARWITALERECTPATRRVAAARRGAIGGVGPAGTSTPRGGADDGLPNGWRSAQDAHGRTFYFNKVTGERTWNHPMAPPPDGMSMGGMSGGGEMGAMGSPIATMHQSAMGQGRPVYGREHDPPPKSAGVVTHNLIELHVHELGFFGVSLDETADPATGKAYVRVSSVDQGSEAHRQLPQLVCGAYLHTVQGRAVGGLHPNAIVNHLKERPLTISFSFTAAEVDEAADEQKRHGLKCPFDTAFVEPVGTPLGIRFMEYESKLGPQHYLCIETLSEVARLTHPELRTGMIVTKVNGLSTARIASTDKVKELLMQRPVRITFTDRMADVETSRTLDVMHAAMKWKAFVKRCRRRRSEGYVLGPGGVIISAPPGTAMPSAAPAGAAGAAPAGGGQDAAAGGAPSAESDLANLSISEGEPPLDGKAAEKAAAKAKKQEAAAKKEEAKKKKDADVAEAKKGGDDALSSLEAQKKKAKAKKAEATGAVDDVKAEAGDKEPDAVKKAREKAKGQVKKGDSSTKVGVEEPGAPAAEAEAAPAEAAADGGKEKKPKTEKKAKKEKKEKKPKGGGEAPPPPEAPAAPAAGGGGGGAEMPEGLTGLEKQKWKKKNKAAMEAAAKGS